MGIKGVELPRGGFLVPMLLGATTFFETAGALRKFLVTTMVEKNIRIFFLVSLFTFIQQNFYGTTSVSACNL